MNQKPYSQMTDEELLSVLNVNGTQATPNYSAMSDEELLSPAFAQQQPNDPGFWTAFKRGLGTYAEGAGAIAEDVGFKDNAIKRFAEDVARNNPLSPAVMSWEGFKQNPIQGALEFMGLGLGSSLPALTPYLGWGAKAASAGALGRTMALGRTLPAQTAIAAIPAYGATRAEQAEAGKGGPLEAALSAIGQGMIESKLGFQRVLGPEPKTVGEMLKTFGKTPLRTAAIKGASTVFGEASEEGPQQVLQQLAAYKNPFEAEQLADTGWSMFGGALGALGPGAHVGMALGKQHLDIGRQLQNEGFVKDNSFAPVDLIAGLTQRTNLYDATNKVWNDAIAEYAMREMPSQEPEPSQWLPPGASPPISPERHAAIQKLYGTEGLRYELPPHQQPHNQPYAIPDSLDAMWQAALAQEYGVSPYPEQPGRTVQPAITSALPVDLIQVETGGKEHLLGGTMDMFTGNATAPNILLHEEEPPIKDINDFITRGLQLEADYQKAVADNDVAAQQRIIQRAQNLLNKRLYEMPAEPVSEKQMALPLQERVATPAITQQKANRVIHAVPSTTPITMFPSRATAAEPSLKPATMRIESEAQPAEQPAEQSTKQPKAAASAPTNVTNETPATEDLDAALVSKLAERRGATKKVLDKESISALRTLLSHNPASEGNKTPAHVLDKAANKLPKAAEFIKSLHQLLAERDKLMLELSKFHSKLNQNAAIDQATIEKGYGEKAARLREITKGIAKQFVELENEVGYNNLQEAQRLDKAKKGLQTQPMMLFSSAYKAFNTGQITETGEISTAEPKEVRERFELGPFTYSKLASVANGFKMGNKTWTGLDALLMKIRFHSQNPFYSLLASRIYHLLQNSKGQVNVELRFYARDPSYKNGASADKQYLFVVNENGTITFDHSVTAPTNAQGSVLPGKTEFNGDNVIIHITESGQNNEVVLHEALHVVLAGYIREHKNAAAVNGLDKLREQVIDELRSRNLSEEERALLAKISNKHGLQEFVSYGLTNKALQDVMKGIEYTEKSKHKRVNLFKNMWNAFVGYVRTILGIKPSKHTAFSDFLTAAGELLTSAKYTPMPSKTSLLMSLSTAPTSVAMNSHKIDMRSYAQRPALLQNLFEQFGYNGDKIKQRAAMYGKKIKEVLRKIDPRIFSMMSLIDSTFSLSNDIAYILDEHKAMKHAPISITHAFISAVEKLQTADEIMAAFNYLDTGKGDVPAHVKTFADELRSQYQQLIDSLPTGSSEEAKEAAEYLRSLKISEALIYVDNANVVASSKFGAHRLNILRGSIVDEHAVEDESFITPKDYDITTRTGTFKRYIKTPANVLAGGKPEFGYVHTSMLDSPEVKMLSAQQRKDLENSGVFKIVAIKEAGGQRELTMRGNPTLRSQVTTERGDVSEEGMQRVRAALLNTMAVLSNAVASHHMAMQLALHTNEKGVNPDVFASKEALWAAYNAENGTIEKRYSGSIDDIRLMEWSEPSEHSAPLLMAYRSPDTWVQLPKSEAYGMLAGKIIRGSEWMAVQDAYNHKNVIDSHVYNASMRLFKRFKTSFNLPTHATNILTNITLAHLNNISAPTIFDAATMIRKRLLSPDKLTQEEIDILTMFDLSGATLADYTTNELKEILYDAITKNLHKPVDSSFGSLMNNIMSMQNSIFETAHKYAKKRGMTPTQIGEMLNSIYAAEDNVFRLAAFMTKYGELQQLADKGQTKLTEEMMLRQAGHFARKAFLDYNIDSRAVQFAKQTFLPFISWTYAITPTLIRLAVEKPWKFVSLAVAYSAVSSLLGAISGGDSDQERAMLNVDDKLFGAFGPYTAVPLPFGKDNQKVFFQLGKFMPVPFTFKDAPNGFLGIRNWPSSLTPNGPIIAFVAAALGVDPYTGEKLASDADTNLERFMKSTEALWRQMTPGGAIGALIPGTKQSFMPSKDRLGQEPDYLANAAALLGAPITSKNITTSYANKAAELDRIESDYAKKLSKLRTDYIKGELTAEEFRKKAIEANNFKMKRINAALGRS